MQGHRQTYLAVCTSSYHKSLTFFVPLTATEKQYKIPVRLWLPKSFPKEGPSVQIHPSPDMMLTAVNYMDAGGMVTIPYLKHWKEVRNSMHTWTIINEHLAGEGP